jgi:hypothetical protein
LGAFLLTRRLWIYVLFYLSFLLDLDFLGFLFWKRAKTTPPTAKQITYGNSKNQPTNGNKPVNNRIAPLLISRFIGGASGNKRIPNIWMNPVNPNNKAIKRQP